MARLILFPLLGFAGAFGFGCRSIPPEEYGGTVLGKPQKAAEWVIRARGDQAVDLQTLAKIGRIIDRARFQNASQQQLWEELLRKEINGFRLRRLEILKEERKRVVKSFEKKHVSQVTASRKRVAKIRQDVKIPPAKREELVQVEKSELAEEQRRLEVARDHALAEIDAKTSILMSGDLAIRTSDLTGSGTSEFVIFDKAERVRPTIYVTDGPVPSEVTEVRDPDEPQNTVMMITQSKPVSVPSL